MAATTSPTLSVSSRIKTIGIIGGSTDVATAEYYRLLNLLTRQRLGGAHTARTITHSMDVAFSLHCVTHNLWAEGAQHIKGMVRDLENARADFVICVSNTWHQECDVWMDGAGIPLLHIATPLAKAVRAKGLKRVGLLGTYATMKGVYLKGLLEREYGLEVVVPEEEEMVEVGRIIFEELTKFEFTERAKGYYLGVVDRLVTGKGAEGVVLGCTEIPLLIKQGDRPGVPFFDTLRLHAEAAVEMALADV